VQIWTSLEEDEKFQQLDQQEEQVNAAMQDLKHRQKAMRITERLKGMQEMKNLQMELKTGKIIAKLEVENTRMEHAHKEST
jgi:hypothetical protein